MKYVVKIERERLEIDRVEVNVEADSEEMAEDAALRYMRANKDRWEVYDGIDRRPKVLEIREQADDQPS